jgi:predicted phosphodiesterase
MAGFQAEVISDTHLNLWKYKPEQIAAIFPGTSPNLILAGDIGDPDEESLYTALDIARKRYKRVIYIPGNHEFYNREPGSKKTPASTLSWFQNLDDQWSNFHFFYRRNELIDGIRVLGATGWSTSPKGTTWSNIISAEGRQDIDFLEQSISRSKEPVLVVTHYPSTLRVLQENFKYKITQYDYAQDLERLYRNPVNTWVFGHVHQAHDFKMPYSSSMNGAGEVRIVCNPYGYPNEGITSPLPKKIFISSSPSASVKSPSGMTYRNL